MITGTPGTTPRNASSSSNPSAPGIITSSTASAGGSERASAAPRRRRGRLRHRIPACEDPARAGSGAAVHHRRPADAWNDGIAHRPAPANVCERPLIWHGQSARHGSSAAPPARPWPRTGFAPDQGGGDRRRGRCSARASSAPRVRPLWPARPPPRRTWTSPKGRSISSWRTTTRSSGTLSEPRAGPAESPESFM